LHFCWQTSLQAARTVWELPKAVTETTKTVAKERIIVSIPPANGQSLTVHMVGSRIAMLLQPHMFDSHAWDTSGFTSRAMPLWDRRSVAATPGGT